MSVTQDILRSYRAPRAVMRRQMAGGVHEGRAVAYLMIACFLIFIAQWPRLSREATLNPDSPPLEAQVMATFFAWVLAAPLLFFLIAALSHGLAKVLGGQGDWFGARLALFWTMLAVSPLMLLHGLVAGFIGPGPQLTIVGAVVALAFCIIWIVSLIEVERPTPAPHKMD